MSRKTALVFGTRPEIIKLSPVIRALQKARRPFFTVHTGQHYTFEMDRLFFRDLGLPEPDFRLDGRSAGRQGEHTARMLTDVETVLLKERPAVVLVQGDTNSVLAAALAAPKIPGVHLGHVEAGLRSYDRQMPEEINRIVADHLSDFLFCPTKLSRDILLKEGIPASKIFVTGNTIGDAVRQNRDIARRKIDLKRWGLKRGAFGLLTLHRQENVDDKKRMKLLFEGIGRVARFTGLSFFFPAHPRTVKKMKDFGLSAPQGMKVVEPVGFLEFLALEEGAKLILTDSGGVQEEACILKKPCVTLRTTTERPETVEVGANLIAGYEPKNIESCARKMLSKKMSWRDPFGDGRAAERILDGIKKAAAA